MALCYFCCSMLPLHHFCHSVIPLLLMPLCVAALTSATPLCVGSIILLTYMSKDMPQQSEWQAQKWVSNDKSPFEDKRSSFYLGTFCDFQFPVTRYNSVVFAYCGHLYKYKQYSTYFKMVERSNARWSLGPYFWNYSRPGEGWFESSRRVPSNSKFSQKRWKADLFDF
jgi:hypothetical protein